ncbi:hypothetical protein ACRALDRAFT_206887 [Sodiomyces alcalophilus JCM 7366]|uniref:uncharacterized protein n=1 Tax=Sodiomyces alcalophilus JCM 7366 TaxID=591952 RepID=UPI0039B3BFD6
MKLTESLSLLRDWTVYDGEDRRFQHSTPKLVSNQLRYTTEDHSVVSPRPVLRLEDVHDADFLQRLA